MWSWAAGKHMPTPCLVGSLWRCGSCGMKLTRYVTKQGRRSLRHHPRGRR